MTVVGSPSPRSYGERVGVRGSRTPQRQILPLTLTLSPRKSGEREESERQRKRPLAWARKR
jgi:hypothetical protein